MRFLVNLVLLLGAALVLAVGAMFLASELGGEVVGLRSFDAQGRGHDTRLWIVDHENRSYLRGNPDSGWYARIEATPQVELERAGETRSFRAIASQSMSEHVNRLMAQKYGVANQMIGLTADVEQNTAIRLEPLRD
jgi:hypothetical protein